MVREEKKPVIAMTLLALILAGCVGAPLIANHDPGGFYLEAVNRPPSGEFYFGTDSLGRDLFSLMFYGGRASLGIGFLGAGLMAIIGIFYGCVSGTANEQVDSLMMGITELCGSIPSLLLMLILTALFPTKDLVSMSLVIGITGWFPLARMVRSEVRQLRNNEYILYARCSGGSFFYVMIRHLIPNCLPAVMFAMISNISAAITTESTLSFLGLGLPPDQLSWGSMLSLANRALITNTWWVIVIPGLFLVVTLLCITEIGDYIQRRMAPGSHLDGVRGLGQEEEQDEEQEKTGNQQIHPGMVCGDVLGTGFKRMSEKRIFTSGNRYGGQGTRASGSGEYLGLCRRK